METFCGNEDGPVDFTFMLLKIAGRGMPKQSALTHIYCVKKRHVIMQVNIQKLYSNIVY